MNTIEKIVLVQISFVIGGVISYFMLDAKTSSIVTNHLILTTGYLYGFWHSKK